MYMNKQFNPDLRNKVFAVDLSCVEKRLIKKDGMTSDEAKQAIHEYREYLCAMDTNSKLSPSPAADKAWHAHILFMAKYFNDCMATHSRILWHTPKSGSKGMCEGGGDCRPQEINPENCCNFSPKDNAYNIYVIEVPKTKVKTKKRKLGSIVV